MNITTGILGFFVLCCTYSAQSWAKQCRDELGEIKEALKRQKQIGLRRRRSRGGHQGSSCMPPPNSAPFALSRGRGTSLRETKSMDREIIAAGSSVVGH